MIGSVHDLCSRAAGSTIFAQVNLPTTFFDRPGHHGISGTYNAERIRTFALRLPRSACGVGRRVHAENGVLVSGI